MSHSFLNYMGAKARLHDGIASLLFSLLIRLIEDDENAALEMKDIAKKWRAQLKMQAPGITLFDLDGYLETDEGRINLLNLYKQAKAVFISEGDYLSAKTANEIDLYKDPQRPYGKVVASYMVEAIEKLEKACI